jgi:3-oxoacyl-(acyl-carrier-protein) synthase
VVEAMPSLQMLDNIFVSIHDKLNFTFNKAQHRTVNAALSNTFGFGGHNASVIVKKYNP